jgi:hypothetical protein
MSERNDLEITVAGRPRDIANLEAPPVGLLHHLDT